MWDEARWELENSSAGEPCHRLLHDLVYYAPWLHEDLAPLIIRWLQANDTANADCLRYARHIIISGGTALEELARLAELKARAASHKEIAT